MNSITVSVPARPTRKYFVALAARIVEQWPHYADRKLMAETYAVECAKRNPAFNHRRFFTACNVNP